ncbi:MAG: ice-binding family protein [Candidatus Woesearchaeota archaeon]|nr:ice-binding family protein [Candidatus Woesearchaeota archaeon]
MKNELKIKQKRPLSNALMYFTVFVLLVVFNIPVVFAVQSPVNLGSAGSFVVLAKSGVSTTGTTLVVGDIGVSPIDSTGITGFGLIMDSSNMFSTSSLVTGKLYAADYTEPTPTNMTSAISAMETAYTDAAGRTLPDATELGAGDISGMTLSPGLYKWGTGVIINNGVTLSGSSTDVWIFQIGEDLTVGNGAIITLSGGALAENIFWQVAGQATLGTTSDVKGIILSQTAIAMNTGTKLNGRALAQTAVTLDASTVTMPAGTATQQTATTPEQTESPTGIPLGGSGTTPEQTGTSSGTIGAAPNQTEVAAGTSSGTTSGQTGTTPDQTVTSTEIIPVQTETSTTGTTFEQTETATEITPDRTGTSTTETIPQQTPTPAKGWFTGWFGLGETANTFIPVLIVLGIIAMAGIAIIGSKK